MATRQFFKRGRIAKATPKPPKPPKPPDHRDKLVMGTRVTELGKKTQAMTSAQAARVMHGRRCGLLAAERGTAYRWTSETARKAAVKSWTKRRKFNHRIGTRIGVKAARRAPCWREPLRQYYAENPTRGITFNTFTQQWYRDNRIVSERAALVALGHLPSKAGYIPDTIQPIYRKWQKR
jgi:hypothetical protein